MSKLDRIAIALIVAGVVWYLTALWWWALYGMDRDIGKAHFITGTVLAVGGFGVGISQA